MDHQDGFKKEVMKLLLEKQESFSFLAEKIEKLHRQYIIIERNKEIEIKEFLNPKKYKRE